MLGTAISLTAINILQYSQLNEDDFEFLKLDAVKNDFLQTIKRLGDFELYNKYKNIVKGIISKDQLISEIDKIEKSLAKQNIDRQKIKTKCAYLKRCLMATREGCQKTLGCLKNDIDILTPCNEGKMAITILKFDNYGQVLPLFKTQQGQKETFVDENGVQRYKINQDVLNFSDLKQYCKFAKTNNLKIHGHTILWHEMVPFQFKELVKSDLPQEMKKKLTLDFLYGYMKCYAQNIQKSGVNLESIEILNEIANDDENSSDYLRKSIWRDLMGDDYYIDVLKLAKQAFPDTKLFYNDFNEFFPYKRNNMIKIIEHIQAIEKKEGTPLLNCVGLQCHLYGNELDYSAGFKEVVDATQKGPYPKEVRVSELDSAPCGNLEWQQKQMEEVVKAADENQIENICFWNFAEQFTDSFEEATGSGVVDENGDARKCYEQVSSKHSEKEKARQEENEG